MFCTKCGSLMLPKKEGNHKVLLCTNPKCGFKSKDMSIATIKETVAKPTREIEIVDDKADLSILPVVDNTCENCGNKKAYFWTLQTRAGDEPETKFYKCQKCGHTVRDYN